MAQLQISVDLSNAGAQAQAIINAQVLPRLNQAVRAVVQATQARWQEAVLRAPGLWMGEKDAYSTSIQSKMTSDFAGEVWSEYKYAQEIEDGRPARDLKKYLQTSQKVRRTKDGTKFLVIPFVHQTPGHEAHAKAMPQEVYDLAKALKPSKVIGHGERESGERVSLHPVRGMRRLKNQAPFLHNPVKMVPKQITQWGGRLMGDNIPKQYQGMVRMKQDNGGGRHSTHLTFRIMSEKSTGWIIPAKPGLKLVAGVVSEMQPLAEKAFGEALRRGG